MLPADILIGQSLTELPLICRSYKTDDALIFYKDLPSSKDKFLVMNLEDIIISGVKEVKISMASSVTSL